jgi:hypothetical protein
MKIRLKIRIDYFALFALFLFGLILCTQTCIKSLKTQINSEIKGVCKCVCKSEVGMYSFANVMQYADSIGNLQPTMGRIDTALSILPIVHKDIVLAQVALESAYAQSELTKTNNNLMAMRKAYQRATMCNGEKYGYATYKNWAYSLLDYALWQDKYMMGLNEEEYFNKLAKIYAADTNYKEKVKKVMKKFAVSKK